MSSDLDARRPGGVTVVVVLTVLVGLLDIVFGILLIAGRNTVTVSGLDASGVLVSGIIEILIGLFVVVVARALSWGSNVARSLVVLLMVLRVIAGVAAMTAGEGALDWQHALVVALAVVIIGLLFTPAASTFFRAHRYG